MSDTDTQTLSTTRGKRPGRYGVVTSDKGDKTIKVVMEYLVEHRKYKKYIRRRTLVLAHDEQNVAREGDQVEIMECRPVSKTKHWRLVRVLTKNDTEPAAGSES